MKRLVCLFLMVLSLALRLDLIIHIPEPWTEFVLALIYLVVTGILLTKSHRRRWENLLLGIGFFDLIVCIFSIVVYEIRA